MAERIRRSKEDIVAEIQKKIEFHEEGIKALKEKCAEYEAKIKKHTDIIEKLEAKKEATLHPKERPPRKKSGMNAVIAKAKEQGMTPEEIAEKLGIEL